MIDKVVLVTGANGGLGTSVTKAFLDAEATVVGTARRIQHNEFSGNFTAIEADLSTHSGAASLIDGIEKKFGRLDVLVHTVGGFAGGTPVAETDDATFQLMFDLNLNATFYLMRAAIPLLRESGDGRIIAVGSRAAVESGANVGAYSASKAAMLSLMRTIAIENRDAGIKANVVLPGTMDTPTNRKAMPGSDFSQWVQPANVASLMLWLAGESAKDVTGAAIPVYGEP
jgi:NAD(P)-dependent dehydrogenase (short-subunit alcohol dehydrogenase family)